MLDSHRHMLRVIANKEKQPARAFNQPRHSYYCRLGPSQLFTVLHKGFFKTC
jgi:hypothetical protein